MLYDVIVIGLIAVLVNVTMYQVIKQQQRTITDLTNRIMSKDYGEYRRLTATLDREEERKRKPQSFYDDTTVYTDDDKV